MVSEVIKLLEQIVHINSVNPDLVPGAPGEGEIAGFIEVWLKERGFETHRLEATKGRPTVVGVAKGTGGGKSLMFNGHTDTVTLEGIPDGLNPTIQDGKLYGRGAYDMKSGVAAMLVAAARAKALNLRGDVLVACVADEEYGSLGSFELVEHFRADAAIITEPSELEMTLAHKGFVWLELTIQGRAAHGSRPDLGVDAIVKAGKVLVELEKLDRRLQENPTHPLLGSGSLHASLISGGQELSSYPAKCTVWLERRTVPGETPEIVEAQIQAILDEITASDPDFKATLRRDLARVPHQISHSESIVQILREQVARVLGVVPRIKGEPFWTDCAVLSEVGIPSFLFGVKGAGAHAAAEWVDLASLERLSEILYQTAKEFCA
ncbi:MAG: ArgE/DapE family deacylase [Thermaceae bacterium]|nr:ArgE/DapE family deacylase [Thermaceae bacterium]